MPTKNGQGTGLGERFHGAKSGSHSALRWRGALITVAGLARPEMLVEVQGIAAFG
jgi:hypothetical protein